MDRLLDFFKQKNIALQIILDIGRRPTVHAQFMGESGLEMHKTEGSTIDAALLNMKYKLFEGL